VHMGLGYALTEELRLDHGVPASQAYNVTMYILAGLLVLTILLLLGAILYALRLI